MGAPLAEIAPRLAPMLLLLGSDKDGEVVNAARLMVRTLTRSGHDLHALAELISAAPAPVIVYRDAPPKPADPPPGATWRTRARWLDQFARKLMSPKEQSFIRDMTIKSTAVFNPSDKQIAWIDGIYNRVRGGF